MDSQSSFKIYLSIDILFKCIRYSFNTLKKGICEQKLIYYQREI